MPTEGITWEKYSRNVLLDPSYRADGVKLAFSEDRVVGICVGMARRVPLENAQPDDDKGYILLLAVDETYRRQGIGGALVGAVEQYLAAEGRKTAVVSPYAPGYFIPGVDIERHRAAQQLFLVRGYTELYRPIAMETCLWDLDIPAWVVEREVELAGEGVQFTCIQPFLIRALLRFAEEEFPGDWVRVCRDTIRAMTEGENPHRLWCAVHESGRVLGFSHFHNERFGPIGVAPNERGRCIGQILMFKTLLSQRAAGFRTSWFLWSDERTAERLYNTGGFKEVRRFAVLRKDL